MIVADEKKGQSIKVVEEGTHFQEKGESATKEDVEFAQHSLAACGSSRHCHKRPNGWWTFSNDHCMAVALFHFLSTFFLPGILMSERQMIESQKWAFGLRGWIYDTNDGHICEEGMLSGLRVSRLATRENEVFDVVKKFSQFWLHRGTVTLTISQCTTFCVSIKSSQWVLFDGIDKQAAHPNTCWAIAWFRMSFLV